jgi:hypothetical protein
MQIGLSHLDHLSQPILLRIMPTLLSLSRLKPLGPTTSHVWGVRVSKIDQRMLRSVGRLYNVQTRYYRYLEEVWRRHFRLLWIIERWTGEMAHGTCYLFFGIRIWYWKELRQRT